jgi:hypothetical protein
LPDLQHPFAPLAGLLINLSMTFAKTSRQTLVALTLLLGTATCMAGRPLAVDDANVNDVGAGHVEMFYQRLPGATHAWTISPAYGVAEGVELAASFNRDNTADIHTTAIQAKFRLTESRKNGCNLATSLGFSQPNGGGLGLSKFINGLASCNAGDAGSVHLNLGLVNPPGGPTVGVWGLAFEREFGAITGHAEVFGQENQAPTVQFGLRRLVTPSLQLDATVGSLQGETLYSVGLKFLF